MAEKTDRSVGRRAIIGGAAAGVAALAAERLSRPASALATHAGPVYLAHTNTSPGATRIESTAQNIAGVAIANGIIGISSYTHSQNGSCFHAVTDGHYSQVAVEVDTISNAGEGIGVRARTKNGIGVYTEATGGYALQVQGRAVFNRSGKALVNAGQSSKTVSTFAIEPQSVVVATVQGNPAGVWVRSVSLNATNNTFTIRLNKSAPSGGVSVGFFIVN